MKLATEPRRDTQIRKRRQICCSTLFKIEAGPSVFYSLIEAAYCYYTEEIKLAFSLATLDSRTVQSPPRSGPIVGESIEFRPRPGNSRLLGSNLWCSRSIGHIGCGRIKASLQAQFQDALFFETHRPFPNLSSLRKVVCPDILGRARTFCIDFRLDCLFSVLLKSDLSQILPKVSSSQSRQPAAIRCLYSLCCL